jgi:glycosyltransferase 2 family protein
VNQSTLAEVDVDGNRVEVLEPPSGRVRRPKDLFALLFAVGLLFAAVATGTLAVGTASGLEQDLVGVSGALPRVLLQLIGWAGGIGLLVLLIVKSVDLVVRSRSWQLFEAVAAAGVGALVALVLQRLVLDGHLGAVLAALTKSLPGNGRSEPIDGVIVASVAFFTVSGVGGRSVLRKAVVLVVGSAILSGFLSGGVTALALFTSAVLGWIVGLLAHVTWGVATNRPPGTAVAAALIGCGLDLARLELVEPGEVQPGRRYVGSGTTGPVDVRVLDRDTFGTAASRRLLRRMRLRGPSVRGPSLTVRAEVEHHALMAMAVARAGVRAPALLAAAEVGPFASVLAYQQPEGIPLSQTGSRVLSDADLTAFWRLLMLLQRAQIAHRGLSLDNLLLDERGRAGLSETETGDIAAADLSLRIDIAQLLTAMALLVGPQRAVTSAVASLGSEAIVRALPLVQRVAMSPSTRSALREHKGLLRNVREHVLELAPEGEPSEPVELRRVTPRTLVMVLGGGIAAYLLLTQLAKVDETVLAAAEWGWALGVVFFTVLTITGASLVITGAVTARLSFVRTYMTQLAVAFSGLVAPSAIGNIALNLRYLQRAGVDPAVAGGSVGLAQLAQFSSYFILLLLSSVLAGTGPQASFTPPLAAVIGLICAMAVLLLALAIPLSRRLVIVRFLPVVRRVVPRVVAIFQDPRKVMTLFAGALLLDVSFVAALTCATRAFGATPDIPAVAVVYFAGAIIGSAVPTPGGLGGVEAALSAGLVAVGLSPGVAVSSVLLFRLCTYWLPIPFGWASLSYLQRVAAI